MSARTPEIVARFTDVMMRTNPRPFAILDHGEGARVWDVDGNEYLDFLAGIAVNALGHAHPAVVETIHAQASRLVHISNYFASEPQLALAERLVRLSGGSRVYFANSGAEAIESAIKLARLTGRTRIVALEASFHGRTMGSLSLTGKPALRAPFEPLVQGAAHIAPTLEALEAEFAEHGDELSAIVIEPIQGEAGVVELPEGFLRRARELTTQHGALLIMDEIQTGAGRTGEWFAFQREGIVPDAITLAKGIGGGVPIGALVTFGSASDLFQPGQHLSTFGGNPLATATADAVLAEIERAGLVENAARRGLELRAAVEGLASPLVREVTGAGLLIGIVLTQPVAAALVAAAQQRGLIINATTDSRIRLAPPLTIGDAEIAEFAKKFAAALSDVQTPAGDTP